MRRVLPALALAVTVALLGSSATAQTWSDGLFPETAHEFGTVARGTKLRYTFWLVNTTGADIQIAGYRPKCGCTDVKLGARTVPPGTRAPIEATLDTTRFQGRKDSGLTLQLTGPTYAEKDLNLGCFIRGDVAMNPGVADFGTVSRGSSPSLVLNLSYRGGQPGWGVVEARTLTKHVTAKVTGPFQETGGGLLFQTTVTLNPSAPVGYFKDEITLVTNDPQAQAIPISVVANIQGAVTVSPGNLVLGRVKAGQTVTRPVMVRSAKPFKITGTTSARPELSAAKAAETEAQVQMLNVTLKAPNQPGAYNAVLEIATNVKDEPPVKVTAFATVEP